MTDREPAAWVAFSADDGSSAVYLTDAEAQAAADAWGWRVASLYVAPSLTDAEREAVQRAAISIASTLDHPSEQAAADYATLSGLLERHGAKDCEK